MPEPCNTSWTLNATAAPRKVLLVRNDRLGDLVLTLPALEAARRAWPHARLALLASRDAGPLLVGHPAIDDLLVDNPADNAWQLAAKLRRFRCDAALVFNTNTRNCLAVWAAGIRTRVCWAYKPLGWLAATHRVKLRRSHPPVHESEFALAFVRLLGVRAELSELAPRLPISASARQQVMDRIHRTLGTEGPLFGVHPGSRHSAYNWPIGRYAQLVTELAQHGRVMVTGSPSEQPLLAAIRRNVPAAARVGCFSDLTLAELSAAIAQQTVLVVSSTGPMHLAGVLGTPTVALFSPHPAHVPAKWAPLGTNHTLLVAPLEPGEDPRAPATRGEALMSRIAVAAVVEAALRYARVSRAEAA